MSIKVHSTEIYEKCYIGDNLLDRELKLRKVYRDEVLAYINDLKILKIFQMKDRYFCLVDNPVLNVNLNLGLLYEIDVDNKRLVELPQNFYKRQDLNEQSGWSSFSNMIAEEDGRYFTIYSLNMYNSGEIAEFNFDNNQFEKRLSIDYNYKNDTVYITEGRAVIVSIKNEGIYFLGKNTSNKYTSEIYLNKYNVNNNSYTILNNKCDEDTCYLESFKGKLHLFARKSNRENYLDVYSYNAENQSYTLKVRVDGKGFHESRIYGECFGRLYADDFIINNDYSISKYNGLFIDKPKSTCLGILDNDLCISHDALGNIKARIIKMDKDTYEEIK